ncbi:MAG: class I SAM-dependent methyltransferase [Flavobacteriales bacterium]|nr:class I SAM-dependent methyltransferase [Flavobacteriales bacterium]
MRYLAKRQEKHGVHSPFVYDLMTLHLPRKKQFACFGDIEFQREKMLENDSLITVVDLGAGSTLNQSQQKKISTIAAISSKPRVQAQVFFKIANLLQPHTILELGTNLGLTTSYLAKACPNAQVVTIEGSKILAEIAKENIHSCGCTNVKVVVGSFDQNLDHELTKLKSVGMAFIDGNHQEEATLLYWSQITKYCDEMSIVIVDDIYWSKGMNNAWNRIKQQSEVSLSLDFFHFGVIFFYNGIEKQHFTLKIP